MKWKKYVKFFQGKTKLSVEFHSFIHSEIKSKMKVEVYIISVLIYQYINHKISSFFLGNKIELVGQFLEDGGFLK